MIISRQSVLAMGVLLLAAGTAPGARPASHSGFTGSSRFVPRNSISVFHTSHPLVITHPPVIVSHPSIGSHRRFFPSRSRLFLADSFPIIDPLIDPGYPPGYWPTPYDAGAVPYAGTSEPPAVPGYGSYAAGSVAVGAPNYLQRGHDWAMDVRQDVATWAQLVAYLKAEIVQAPAAAREEFGRGFIAAYGENGSAAWAKALQQAGAGAPAIPPAIPSPATTSEPAPRPSARP